MKRRLVAAAIRLARGLAESYERRLNGAGPPGWWQVPQYVNKIGAMSLENVGALAPVGCGVGRINPCGTSTIVTANAAVSASLVNPVNVAPHPAI